MYLGIEIGGTKLQLGVGPGDGPPLVALERITVEPGRGSEWIRRQIVPVARRLIDRHGVAAVGVGFGGPVDVAGGRTITSHQVQGWDDYPLADWCRRALGLPTVLANDSDSAGMAEARFGAGQGQQIVFYNNIGSGIGGALVIHGQLYRGAAGVASELGHLRPGLDADRPDRTLESIASGWAITAAVENRLRQCASMPARQSTTEARLQQADGWHERVDGSGNVDERDVRDLLDRLDGRVDRLTTKTLAQAACESNGLARSVFAQAAKALGWGLAQMITLLAPDIVVLGGGVSLAGEDVWIGPVRRSVQQYVFPPLRDKIRIVPSALGEEVVLYGALALASAAPSREGKAI